MNFPFYLNNPDPELPNTLTTRVLSDARAQNFHASLKDYAPTPLHDLNGQAKKLGINKLYVKDESHRFGLNAFKALGASYAINHLLQKDPDIKAFCTATDGNHGRAVAWSARMHNKQAHVFVPKETTPARIDAIKNEGATVVQMNMDYDETCDFAAQQSNTNGWTLVQDTARTGYEEIPAFIKAGYLTHFIELKDSIHSTPHPEVDIVFLQAGVGSWPAAAVWYYRNRYGKKAPKMVLVEPQESSGILQSFRKGSRSRPTGKLNSIMAGLNCGIPSLTAWEILQAGVDAAIEIPDTMAVKGMKRLYHPEGRDPQIIAGESGIGGFAGLLAVLTEERFLDLRKALKISSQSRVLVYNTEGDTDKKSFREITVSK